MLNEQERHNVSVTLRRLSAFQICDIVGTILPILQGLQPDEIRYVCQSIIEVAGEHQRKLKREFEFAANKLNRVTERLERSGMEFPTNENSD